MLAYYQQSQFSCSEGKSDRVSKEGEFLYPFELTDEELAILLDEEIEREPDEEELRLLTPGHEQRILAGVLERIGK